MTEPLAVTREGRTLIVAINRPERRNAVDLATSRALHRAFLEFDTDTEADIAILTGNGGAFCAGADLRALSSGERKPVEADGDFAPMGPTRLKLSKPVDLLPVVPSFIRRVCSGYAPDWGRVANSIGVSPLRLECGRWVL